MATCCSSSIRAPTKPIANRAAADVKRFRTTLDLAKIEQGRVRHLKESGAVSQEEVDERESTVAQAESNVAGAEAALESADLNMGFTRVISPIDGRVSRAEVTKGNLVTGGNNGGTFLTSVVSLDPIYLYSKAMRRLICATSNWPGPVSDPARGTRPIRCGRIGERGGFPHEGKMDFVDTR